MGCHVIWRHKERSSAATLKMNLSELLCFRAKTLIMKQLLQSWNFILVHNKAWAYKWQYSTLRRYSNVPLKWLPFNFKAGTIAQFNRPDIIMVVKLKCQCLFTNYYHSADFYSYVSGEGVQTSAFLEFADTKDDISRTTLGKSARTCRHILL